MITLNNKNILILAPHTDDGEIGAGGSINKLIGDNNNVSYIAFSICEKSVPRGYPKNVLETEVKKATKVLGISKENLFIHKFPVREFPKHRQEILEMLVEYNKKLKPDIVFCPSSHDVHQDHQVIHGEALRTFRNKTLLGYEFMWNNYNFSSTLFIKLRKRHINKKIEAISAYESQEKRLYTKNELIIGQANFRGLQISTEYAEAFEAIRIIYE